MATKIVMAVTNDLVTDQRVHRIASALSAEGMLVTVVGRRLMQSKDLRDRTYRCQRMRLLFASGICFYAEYNIRLFMKLLVSNADIYTANDLDTLPAVWLAAAIRRKKTVYDSHEYFTEVPELVHRPATRAVWQWIEARLVPRVDACMTVCQSIADIYSQKYRKPFAVVRNLPTHLEHVPNDNPAPRNTIIYQGTVNIGRGLELMIEALPLIPDAELLIVGGGDILAEIQALIKSKGLCDRATCTGQVPMESVRSYTLRASLGISLEENMGLNYYYALPNKLFDYIQSAVPVVVSDLPEMRRIVSCYGVGRILEERTPEALAKLIREMLADHAKRAAWRRNAQSAAKELCWELEKNIVIQVYCSV